MYFVFQLCRELDIDDPPAWFNAVPESLVDWWLAFYLVEKEVRAGQGGMVTPAEAGAQLGKR